MNQYVKGMGQTLHSLWVTEIFKLLLVYFARFLLFQLTTEEQNVTAWAIGENFSDVSVKEW